MTRALLASVLALGFALPASAAGPPPTIAELNGRTFEVRASGTSWDLNGSRFKDDVTITWTITQTSANTVSFDSVFGGMSFTAYYVDGFLMSSFAIGGPPAEEGSVFQAAVSGNPGKLKLKGTLTSYDAATGFTELSVQKVTGSEIAP
jgi:hypothetical protein